MDQHLTSDEIESLLGGSADPALRNRALSHLLPHSRCSCLVRFKAMNRGGWHGQQVLSAIQELAPPPVTKHDYDAVFDRVEASFALFLSDGQPVQEPPGVVLAELAPLPSGEKGADAVSPGSRMAIPFLTKWLIARSHAVRHEAPGEMLHWALMARLAADSCSVEVAGSPGRLADLQARAWGQLGNALRVCGRYVEAGDLLETAEASISSGTGDLALRAQLFSLFGSLHTARGDFHDAIEILRESARIYEKIGEEECLASSLVQQATAVHYSGEPERSLHLLDRALSLIQPARSPDLLLAARLNRARFSIAIDPPDCALSSFLAVRKLRPGLRCSTLLLRATWQEGQMFGEVGYLESAEAALLQARGGYIEKGLAPEVLAVSCDLISLYRRRGDWPRLEQTILSTREVLSKGRVEPEMLSSFPVR
jgi:tetratricopeptide (TPR) repeat protein